MSLEVGIISGIVEALAPVADPEVIAEAVNDYLEDHPEATCPIDDTAGEGDTGKVWSADKTDTEVEALKEAIATIEGDIGTVEATAIPFSVDNSYIDSNGEVQSATGYAVTDFIDLTGVDAVSFAGKMGSSNTVFWYDEDKEFISGMLTPSDKMIWFYNVLMLKPSTAKYLRLVSKKTTASNPPPIAPEATVFKGKKYIEYLASSIVGDGITDDTMAVRRIVNMGTSVTFPAVEKIKLTGTVNVQMGYAKVLDGNGVTLIATDDFFALTVEGTLNSSASPSNINEYVLKSEGGAIIKNFKMTASDPAEGGGIDASKAFNLRIEDNYIYSCATGIRFSGMNRDIIISGNHIFAIYEDAVLFDTSVNFHQCNIVNNMIMFAMNDINVNNPSAIANFQIVGNDIEIVSYPASGYVNAKCIVISCSSAPDMCGEIEISGNTIQSHMTSVDLIYLSGHADEPISDVSITGNHISNSGGRAIYLNNCLNVAITGNNYTSIRHFVYELYGACTNILICGETARDINTETVDAGGKIHADSGATLTNVRCKNVICTPHDDVDIDTSSVTNVDVEDEASANGVNF